MLHNEDVMISQELPRFLSIFRIHYITGKLFISSQVRYAYH